MNKKLRDFIVLLLIFFSLIFTFYGIVFITTDHKKANIDIAPIKEIEIEPEEDELIDEEYIEPYTNNLPVFRNNYGNNNIMGIIEIPGVINEALIARAGDNEYYLNRNLWNQYDGIGAPFFDFRNTDLDHNRQINIYGHNSQNINILDRLPLSKLINYLDTNFFNTYKDIYLYTDTQKIHYEVIGVKIIEKANNSHMTLNFYDDNDFIDHTNNLLNGSTNKKDVTITKKDRILILQTCNYNPPDSLVIIICKTV